MVRNGEISAISHVGPLRFCETSRGVEKTVGKKTKSTVFPMQGIVDNLQTKSTIGILPYLSRENK